MKEKMNETIEQVENAGREVKEAGRNLWLAGLGVTSSAQERGRKVFDRLVERGQKAQEEGLPLVPNRLRKAGAKARSLRSEVENKVEDRMTQTLHRLGVPARDEVHTLIDRIEQLTQKVEGLTAAQR